MKNIHNNKAEAVTELVKCLPGRHEAGLSTASHETHMVVGACDPHTREVEAGGSEATSLGYKRSYTNNHNRVLMGRIPLTAVFSPDNAFKVPPET